MADDEYDDDAEFEDGDEYEDEYEDGEFEDDEEDAAFEDGDDGFDDADFGDGDDGFDDDDGGWGADADIDVNADQQDYIPIEQTKPDEDSDEAFELDKDGNIITPNMKSLERQKSEDNQCWKCSNCGATNS